MGPNVGRKPQLGEALASRDFRKWSKLQNRQVQQQGIGQANPTTSWTAAKFVILLCYQEARERHKVHGDLAQIAVQPRHKKL